MQIKIDKGDLPLGQKTEKYILNKISSQADKVLSHIAPDLKISFLKLKKLVHGQGYEAKFEMSLPKKEKIIINCTGKKLADTIDTLRHQIISSLKKYKQKISNRGTTPLHSTHTG